MKNSLQELVRRTRGRDTLSGGIGNDTYIFNAGDGVDTIVDSQQHTDASGLIVHDTNTLRLGAGIAASAITTTIDPASGQVVLNLGPSTGLYGVYGSFLRDW